jgi:hypothetical protein
LSPSQKEERTLTVVRPRLMVHPQGGLQIADALLREENSSIVLPAYEGATQLDPDRYPADSVVLHIKDENGVIGMTAALIFADRDRLAVALRGTLDIVEGVLQHRFEGRVGIWTRLAGRRSFKGGVPTMRLAGYRLALEEGLTAVVGLNRVTGAGKLIATLEDTHHQVVEVGVPPFPGTFPGDQVVNVALAPFAEQIAAFKAINERYLTDWILAD